MKALTLGCLLSIMAWVIGLTVFFGYAEASKDLVQERQLQLIKEAKAKCSKEYPEVEVRIEENAVITTCKTGE